GPGRAGAASGPEHTLSSQHADVIRLRVLDRAAPRRLAQHERFRGEATMGWSRDGFRAQVVKVMVLAALAWVPAPAAALAQAPAPSPPTPASPGPPPAA